VVAGLATLAVITAAMLSARTKGKTLASSAPGFALPSTADHQVTLAGLRGRPVLLYFNEGAGCDACFYQMVDIEQHKADFERLGVTVEPIAMNGVGQLQGQLSRFRLSTPWLTDDGAVSASYHMLGKGMHAGLPGHGFVLIDARGVMRWQAEYPSMNIPSSDLIREIQTHLQPARTA
jgi:peroxiredoxin